MKAFHTVAVPHEDILEGRLKEEVFAADLWQVYTGRAPADYKDPNLFFRRTYETVGIRRLVNAVKSRLDGEGGNSVIQLQTPFGGGKTHSLIYLYHKSKEWNANVVVIVGDRLRSGDSIEDFETLWGAIEKQLTGEIRIMNTKNAPDGEKIRTVLERHQPLLILIDEIIPYLNRAAAVKIGDTNLASLTLNFIQTLTEIAGTLEKVSVVMTTTPSNPYDRSPQGEMLVQQLKTILSRVEAIETPVNPQEVSNVIKRRLFESIDENEALNIITEFVTYARRENILPQGVEPSEYMEQFKRTYPFLPEVIDVLYERWGTFPEFQRTRGVLKFLSQVIHELIDRNIPYISLADINLENEKIRSHLINVIGDQYNGILDADIAGSNSNAKIVDKSLGGSYVGMKFGTRAARTIFMYSFSGGAEQSKGATIEEIKRSAAVITYPSAIVDTAVQKLREKMFYLVERDGRYYISNKPNVNRIILMKMENIQDEKIREFEERELKKAIGGFSVSNMDVYIWPSKSEDVPDDEHIKLVVLPRKDEKLMLEILGNKGRSPRINKNTLIFLYPSEARRAEFITLAKKILAYREFIRDPTYKLEKEELEKLKQDLKDMEDSLLYEIKKFYSVIALPKTARSFVEEPTGIPPLDNQKLDKRILNWLKGEEYVISSLTPNYIKNEFLQNKRYENTILIYRSFLSTPGTIRILNKDVLKSTIKNGVETGTFGLGKLENSEPVCIYYKTSNANVTLDEGEVVIDPSICEEQAQKKKEHKEEKIREKEEIEKKKEEQKILVEPKEEEILENIIEHVHLKFKIPEGKVSDVMFILKFLQNKFKDLKISIDATNGSITIEEYENKVKEALEQLGIELEKD